MAIVLPAQTESQTQIELRTVDFGVIWVQVTACAEADG